MISHVTVLVNESWTKDRKFSGKYLIILWYVIFFRGTISIQTQNLSAWIITVTLQACYIFSTEYMYLFWVCICVYPSHNFNPYLGWISVYTHRLNVNWWHISPHSELAGTWGNKQEQKRQFGMWNVRSLLELKASESQHSCLRHESEVMFEDYMKQASECNLLTTNSFS